MDPLTPSPDWALLDAYFAGELDPATAESVRAYLARTPEVESLFRKPDAFVPSANQSRPIDTRAMWQSMERRIASTSPAIPSIRRDQPGIRRYLTPALVGLAAAAALFGVVQTRTHRTQQSVVATQEYSTRPGQRATVQLADGSTVLMAPATRLRVQATGGTVRDVQLDGEAYFTVHSQSDAPFVVRAGDGVVRVLGTEFAVRRYASDSTVGVVVASGRVAVRDRADHDGVGVILGAADAAQLGPRNRVVVTRGVSVEEALAWRTGQLHFRQIPVSSLVRELSRAYDLDIQISDSAIARLPVTTTVHETTASGMLDVLSLLLNVDVQRNGRHVTLVKRAAR